MNNNETPEQFLGRINGLIQQQEAVTTQLANLLSEPRVQQIAKGTIEEGLKSAIAVRHWLQDCITVIQQIEAQTKQREDLAIKPNPKDVDENAN